MTWLLRRIAALVLIAAMLAPVAARAQSRPENDPLNGQNLNYCLWDNWSPPSGGTVTPGAALVLGTSATSAPSQAQVFSQYMLTGDFSFSVSVTMGGAWSQTVAPTDQEYASLAVYADSSNQIALNFGKTPSGAAFSVYATIADSSTFTQGPATAASSAQLQISRSGGTLSFQFNTGAGWQTVTTVSFAAPVLVELGATTIGTPRALAASFSNFVLASGASTYRPYTPSPVAARSNFASGGVLSDYLAKRIWGGLWQTVDPLAVMKQNGMGWVRSGMTTVSDPTLASTPVAQWGTLGYQNSFWDSLQYTSEIFREAAADGLQSELFFYLSDGAAYFGNQVAPAAWQGLSVAQTAAQVQSYTQQTMSYLQSQGITVRIVDLGNEIDIGILDFLPGDRIPLPAGISPTTDLTYMQQQVWPIEATLLKAAAAGVRAVQPDAKIVLHIAGLDITPADVLAKGFFQAMVANGVDFDVAGLSLPYASNPWHLNNLGANCWFQRLQETTDYISGLGKQVMISESGYPYDSTAEAATPFPEFPFTQQGQADWVAATLQFANNDPNFAGMMYFYPDWNPQYGGTDPASEQSENSGLFSANETPLPATAAFQELSPSLASPLFSAVLPASRSIEAGATATAFATLINSGTTAATGCGISPADGFTGSFLYQTTNPATNQLIGSPNQTAAIAAGRSQSFLIALTPTIPLAPTSMMFDFACTGAAAASSVVGLNTLLLSASATPVPDIVALAASGDPGYVDIPGTSGSGAFAIATVNLGAAAAITATANTGGAVLPVTLFVCQTNPQTGNCLATPAASVTTTIAANATPTFAIFVAGGGTVADLPAANRIFVTFTDGSGAIRGSTSVAVRTQ